MAGRSLRIIQNGIRRGPRGRYATEPREQRRYYALRARQVLDYLIGKSGRLDDPQTDSLLAAVDALDAGLISQARRRLLLALTDQDDLEQPYGPSVERRLQVGAQTPEGLRSRIGELMGRST